MDVRRVCVSVTAVGSGFTIVVVSQLTMARAGTARAMRRRNFICGGMLVFEEGPLVGVISSNRIAVNFCIRHAQRDAAA